MASMKRVSVSQAKEKPGQMGRKEALEAFKRISEATGILAWREERGRYVQTLTSEQARQFQDGLEDNYPPDEELKEILQEDRKAYERFWAGRLAGRQLFDEGYDWLPECTGLVMGKPGDDVVVLIERTAEMMILLSEDPVRLYPDELTRLRYDIACCYELDYGYDLEKLVRPLHQDTLGVLLDCLNGGQIYTLIMTETPEIMGTEGIVKLASCLDDYPERLEKLGAYCAYIDGWPLYEISMMLRKYGGKKGEYVADRLMECLEKFRIGLEEALKRERPVQER
jgi:hypothetical protein